MSLTSGNPGWRDTAKLAAGGFRQVVANAACSPQMSRDLCVTNAEHLGTWIDLFVAELRRCQRVIESGDHDQALTFFQAAFDAHGAYLAGETTTETHVAPMPTVGQAFQQLFVGHRLFRPRGQRDETK